MSKVKTRDGTEIFYKDWGSGQPIVFSHGWPLSGDAWDARCCSSGSGVIASSLTTGAVMAGPINHGTAIRWSNSAMISPI